MSKNPFEKWIQESAPSVEVNKLKKEVHLSVLKQRLREREAQHIRRVNKTRRTSVALAALLVVLVGGNFSELGSDGFNIIDVIPSSVPGYDLSITGFRGDGIMVLKEDSPELIEEFSRMIDAGLGIPLDVESYSVRGKEFWSLNREYQARGITRNYSKTVLDRENEIIRDHLTFLQAENELMMEQIDSGTLLPISIKAEMIEGIPFMIETYEYLSEEFGKVVYKRGEPISE